ncbi:unnamed protein product, partial [Toxocara canis]|uniref:SH3 domain-containing protein n=1 Tax=Toxocara canis TaxID=6265 RepID=A0A183UQX8_TOXCA
SLSRSSSSVSPLPRPSPDPGGDAPARIISSSPPVNVLMRNGTTIAVSRGSTHISSGGSFRANRSLSPTEAFTSRRSSSYAPLTGSQAGGSSSPFKGTTFGKRVTQDETPLGSCVSYTIQLHSSSSTLDDNPELNKIEPSPKVAEERLHLAVCSTDTLNKESVQQPTEKISSTLETVITAPPSSLTNPQANTPTTMPNYYARAPGSLKLASDRDAILSSRSGDDLRLHSSAPLGHVPALPSQPKPKLYHRSSSEYNQPLPNVGALRDLHEQKMASRSSTHRRTSPVSKSESLSGSAVCGTASNSMSTSFATASTSTSLDPIPLAAESEKEDTSAMKDAESRVNKASKAVTERQEKILSRAGKNETLRTASGSGSVDEGANKSVAFTSFESARASFMTPSELARFSANVASGGDSLQFHKKTNSSDGVISTHRTPASSTITKLTRAAPPPPVGQITKLKPPIPAPRRQTGVNEHSQKECVRRCRALYDCLADNPDELSFRQGDIIIVSKERIAGENDTWMEGYLASDPQRKGVFPITFVTFQS